MNNPVFNWQQPGWPNATVNRSLVREELRAFSAAKWARMAQPSPPRPSRPKTIGNGQARNFVAIAGNASSGNKNTLKDTASMVLGTTYMKA